MTTIKTATSAGLQ